MIYPDDNDLKIYKEKGYRDRLSYLTELSEIYDVPLETVLCLADILGSYEDFDGLIISLEDYWE